MPYTFDSALDDNLVHVIERDDKFGRYVIRIGTLKKRISIELRRAMTADETEYTVSHSIHTPTQIGEVTLRIVSAIRGNLP